VIDTHTHSHHSPDGKAPMAAMVAAAKAAGLTGIAFTEHAEWYPGDEAYGFLDLPAYFAELERVRDRHGDTLSILAGVELGNPHDFPNAVSAMLDRWPFDLVIGSVHWLDDRAGWEPPIFLERGIEATYQRYFEVLLRMVEDADFDVLGHLDLVRRDSWDLFQQVLDLDPYQGMIDSVLQRLIESERGLEVNTSALRKGLTSPVPGLAILRRYRQLGGEIVVLGSDGHQPAHVAHGFDAAQDLIRAAGFTRVARFSRRQVVDWISL
jgi:histidinol-phosphatase (PHP family)